MTVLPLSDAVATRLAEDTGLIWHQRIALSANVTSPGTNDIEWLMDKVGVPEDLTGLSVLDIGTCNGGAAFLAEQRGARRVVGVDIYDPEWFGFDKLAAAVGSKVEFVKTSVYELPTTVAEKFDVVLCLGVVYHLRHPLLAVDALRAVTGGRVYVETASCADRPDMSHSEFYPTEYRGDSSNWFVPSERCLRDWFSSSGFAVERTGSWPTNTPTRSLLVGTPAVRAYEAISYEVPLSVAGTLTT